MSYWYSKATGVQSYVQGVNYGALMQDALNPKNKSEENERLSISSSQEDYFKKQQMIKEAMQQLQNNGYVEPKIAKEVDVEALKESLQKANNGESSGIEMLGSAESSEAKKQSLMSAKNEALKESTLASAIDIENKMQNQPQNALDKEKQELEAQKKMKENILQSVENDTLVKRGSKKDGILDKAIVQTNSKAPSDISEEVKEAYNPLEITEKSDKSIKQAVEFTDEVSGKKISVPLSDENAQKLIEKFGSLEEASDYVKGFYYDAAYKMGYLSGDSDGDGKISLEEGVHLKSLVSLRDGSYYSIADRLGGELESQKKFLEQVGFIDNISDFINHSIAQDSDFDGAITLNEMMGDDGKAVLFKVGEQASGNVEMFVIWKFNFDLTQESLGDTLLNLGAKDEAKVEVADKKDIKEYADKNYLEALGEIERANVLKSEALLKNIIESA
ncbi:hypothetical protein [Helicobacter winghamensis]|uniref:Uncharacterized protein n=1 Tax=Helicobacter winghamensis TaxID=157268 RepID=A0A2N3PIZ5_9HELI|nr:hypothetical protein [Helicobacter winghamensis]EEO25291.1 hypothetical protein HWAG_00083 [Helicobacter winghamensis ATCC BAA-430]PKT76333.1 hypothetical protein BCM35_06325 [Helicobacter winghamensis]PKT76464.1 hypothetical protein BCM32_03480 [Helicobacter winghamensis]PKT76595.1 hypothetical protein BCM34_04855 [Helicobacter winghamensis]PKT80844.1 hypothetical protein BCM31_02465 [Helicobacter winghamensis]